MFRLSSALVKILQIPPVIFESTRQFSFNLSSIFSHIKHNSSVIFSLNIIYALVKASPLKCRFLRFSSAWVKIRHISHVNSSIFVSFFIVMTHISPINFKHIHFKLWTKESHQGPNYETFKCSGEILLNSTCHFWKNKSVIFQTFCQS